MTVEEFLKTIPEEKREWWANFLYDSMPCRFGFREENFKNLILTKEDLQLAIKFLREEQRKKWQENGGKPIETDGTGFDPAEFIESLSYEKEESKEKPPKPLTCTIEGTVTSTVWDPEELRHYLDNTDDKILWVEDGKGNRAAIRVEFLRALSKKELRKHWEKHDGKTIKVDESQPTFDVSEFIENLSYRKEEAKEKVMLMPRGHFKENT